MTAGAPLLGSLQGRERRCLSHEIFDKAEPGAASRIVPTLRKEREEWGTHFLIRGGDSKAVPRPRAGTMLPIP